MHKPSLSQLVHSALFPKPRANDPSSFASHITRNLVPEVRLETSAFYGTLDCIEAQYPGLDYSFPPHRMRLGRFPNHRRLFRAFDELGLTEAEIASLCRWEGTKSARDRYEQDEEVPVRDTTADDVSPATPPRRPTVHVHFYEHMVEQSPLERVSAHQVGSISNLRTDGLIQGGDAMEEESSDDEMESYGVALNQRLLEATAARQRGANVPLDEDWEQWLKEAAERGGYADMINSIRSGDPLDYMAHAPSSSSMLTPATSVSSESQGNATRVTSEQSSAAPNRVMMSSRSSLLLPLVTTGRALDSPNPNTRAAR
ncbi:hypothetical protein AJ80_09129 [Polytolypa hystricis UAMH7299]|uniref:Uncharacterized protein n=1 Tax=Polytolypa hystricis (strain UAMH7299) TaxID=1447883 RepID=A0A2B7WW27_POLH7|nr:hypothetical protein AJ80_09129 [Polytolypa hystricis UAMH7299]